MKKLLLLGCIFFSLKGSSQTMANDIIGKWMVIPKENLSINVYKTGKDYTGKVIWVKDTSRAKPGFVILEKLTFNQRTKTWENGKIHNPNGKGTYSAVAKIKEDGNLEVHAYKGFKFMGTNKVFKRLKN